MISKEKFMKRLGLKKEPKAQPVNQTHWKPMTESEYNQTPNKVNERKWMDRDTMYLYDKLDEILQELKRMNKK